MANIVIVKTGNSLIVTFNAYGSNPNIDSKSRGYSIENLSEIDEIYDETHIIIHMSSTHEKGNWSVTWDAAYLGTEYFIIDSVDGVAPTSQADLFSKLNALR